MSMDDVIKAVNDLFTDNPSHKKLFIENEEILRILRYTDRKITEDNDTGYRETHVSRNKNTNEIKFTHYKVLTDNDDIYDKETGKLFPSSDRLGKTQRMHIITADNLKNNIQIKLSFIPTKKNGRKIFSTSYNYEYKE